MKKEQLIITDTVETSGCVSYWRIASDTNLDTLTTAWKKHGLDPANLPKPPEDLVALGRAVNSMAEKRRLVRPLARRGAWAIVEEHVTSEQAEKASEFKLKPVTYRTLVTVHAGGADAPKVLMVDASGAEWAKLNTDIIAAYSDARHTLAHHDISSWLLDIAYKKLGAVSLRNSGGVYFIPRKGVEEWNKVATAVGEAGSDVFAIPAMRTAEAVAAITDAITQEAAAIATKIEGELVATGDEALGQRAIKTRIRDAEALLAKLATYEELVGRQLEIRERITTMQANAAVLLMSVETEAA